MGQQDQQTQHGRTVAWKARQALLSGQDVTLDLVGLDRLRVTDVYLRPGECVIVDQDETEMAVQYQDVIGMTAIGSMG